MVISFKKTFIIVDLGSSSSIIYRPSDILPNIKDGFFRYRGSFTIPPCTEVVTWTLMAEPICISRQEV